MKSYIFTKNHSSFRIIRGLDPIPESYFIGEACKEGHGIEGKAVRYKTSRACVECTKVRNRKSRIKTDLKGEYQILLNKKKALEIYDSKEGAEDYDPLFD